MIILRIIILVVFCGYSQLGFSATITVSNTDEFYGALDNLNSGDTILMEAGVYGYLAIENRVFSRNTFIKAMPGHEVTIPAGRIVNCERVTIEGIQIRPDVSFEWAAIRIENGRYNQIRGMNISYTDSATDWSLVEWSKTTRQAIQVRGGSDHKILSNTIRNTYHGIDTNSDNTSINNNTIEGFAGDGIRIHGANYVKVFQNYIANSFNVDDNHDDGIQAWTTPGRPVMRGLRIAHNRIIHRKSRRVPFPGGSFQGIGLFDGMYDDARIFNNQIITDSYIGIALYGAQNSFVTENTAINWNSSSARTPRIEVLPHKDGRPSINVGIERNVAAEITGPSVSGSNIEVGRR